MTPINIKGTYRTPSIYINIDEGLFELKGRSVLENHADFFKIFFEKLNEYLQKPKEKTIFNFSFDYMDSRTSIIIGTILNKIKDASSKDLKFEINWEYIEEDVDMKENIEDYQHAINIPINIKTKKG